MRNKIFLLVMILFAGTAVNGIAQTATDSLGLPGDNLDLYAVLNLFKESKSMDDFEKSLNDPDKHINNLDLNNDGQVDYLRVVDHVDGDAHTIVIQDPVNTDESQDVAVIGIEKNGDASAQIQIIGDDELYGKDYIVEPQEDDANKTNGSVNDGQMRGFSGFSPSIVIVNVWMWPCVRFVYAPAYVVWVSPWRWMYWPGWWRPWHPVVWRTYYGYGWHCHHYYRCVDVYRVTHVRTVYAGYRVASPAVHRNYADAHRNYEAHRAAAGSTVRTAPGGTKAAPRDAGTGRANGKVSPAPGGTRSGKNAGGKSQGAHTGPRNAGHAGGAPHAGPRGGGKPAGGRAGGGHAGGGGRHH